MAWRRKFQIGIWHLVNLYDMVKLLIFYPMVRILTCLLEEGKGGRRRGGGKGPTKHYIKSGSRATNIIMLMGKAGFNIHTYEIYTIQKLESITPLVEQQQMDRSVSFRLIRPTVRQCQFAERLHLRPHPCCRNLLQVVADRFCIS